MPTKGSARGRAAAEPKTFAQMLASRDTGADSRRRPRSFNLPEDLVTRAAATTRGVQARAYGTGIAEEVPDSLTRLVQEAVEAACTYYEDVFNGGQPFPPAQLSPGPGARGAREGAAKRMAARTETERPEGQRAAEIEEAAGRHRRAGARG